MRAQPSSGKHAARFDGSQLRMLQKEGPVRGPSYLPATSVDSVRRLLRRSRYHLELDRIGLEPGAERAEVTGPIEDRPRCTLARRHSPQAVEFFAQVRP